jgi:uridine phosphorylase
VANRILSVGDAHRAWKISRFFDKLESSIYVESTRSFRIFTGTFKGVPISIVATGMGSPMMDFVVRECKKVVDGPMAIMRQVKSLIF